MGTYMIYYVHKKHRPRLMYYDGVKNVIEHTKLWIFRLISILILYTLCLIMIFDYYNIIIILS